MRPTIVLFAVLGLATAAAAQADTVVCRVCSKLGTLPCKKHDKNGPDRPGGIVQWCSEVVTCKVCAGAMGVDCKSCQNEAAEQELTQRKQLAKDWLEKRRKDVDAVAGTEPFLHLATTHFDLACTLRPITIDRQRFDTHARMHLYGERLEALRSLFLQVLELPDGDLPDRMQVFAFDEQRDHAAIGPRVTGMGNGNSVGLKLMGPEYAYSMWQDRRTLPDDEAVHRNIVHNTTHLLLSQMPPVMWLGNRQHGWVDEGVANWFEDKIGGKCTNYCYEEVLIVSGAGFKGGKWRPAVRKLVDEGKVPTFAALSGLNTDQLTYEQHAFAFAYVDWLITAYGGAKFRDFVRLIKKEQPTRDAMTTVYGLNMLTIDSAFATWVQANYLLLPPR